MIVEPYVSAGYNLDGKDGLALEDLYEYGKQD